MNLIAHFLALLILSLPLTSAYVQAAKSPYARDINLDDSITSDASDLTTADAEMAYYLSVADAEAEKLQATFGYMNADGEYISGSLGKLKLKPSDKKRLIKIANGSLTEREKRRIQYDRRLMELLVLLSTPAEFGGGGMEHLRVDDILQFRQDPRSRETDGTDNLSAHQFGRAADIVEINKASCTQKSLIFGSNELPPFPVKVNWQGGAPFNPAIQITGSFDSLARLNAFRDILGTIPGESYNGHIQGMEDLLQQLQRRVIAQEADLPAESLDFLVNNDVLETLGRAATNASLGYPAQALRGRNPNESLRSLATSFFEKALDLPPSSFVGNDLNTTLERVGRMKVALDNDINPEEILKGQVDRLKRSNYYKQGEDYEHVEEAYRLPKGILDKLLQNNGSAYREVGALLMADRLHYSQDEREELLTQAKQGTVAQLNLARFGDILDFPGNVLPMIAPGEKSSKAQGEEYLGKLLTSMQRNSGWHEFPDAVRDVLGGFVSKSNQATPTSITEALIGMAGNSKESAMYRQVGAKYMEEAFDLPQASFTHLFSATGTPTLDQFLVYLGQREIEEFTGAKMNDYRSTIKFPGIEDSGQIDSGLGLPSGTADQFLDKKLTAEQFKKRVGEVAFQDASQTLYHTSSVGLAAVTLQDMFTIMLGQVSDASTRAGASWVEEDLGLTPDSFASLFSKASAEEKLVNAGVNVIGGEIYEAFEIDAKDIQDGETLKRRLGQAKIETSLGLKPGSFRDSLSELKTQNYDRFKTIFAKPALVDIILGAANGSAKKLIDGQLALKDLALAIGELHLQGLTTDTLPDRLGWNGNFVMSGNALLEAISKGSAKMSDGKEEKTYTLRELLALIGSYNTDNALGYKAGTMKKWAEATNESDRNRILMLQGGLLYTDRLGIKFDYRGDLLATYTGQIKTEVKEAFGEMRKETEDELRNRVKDQIRTQLEKPIDQLPKNKLFDRAREFIRDQIEDLDKEIDNVGKKHDKEVDESNKTPEEKELEKNKLKETKKKLQQQLDKLEDDTRKEGVEVVLGEVRDQLRDISRNLPTSQAIRSIENQVNTIANRIESEIAKVTAPFGLRIPIDIPALDINSFLEGDTWLSSTVLGAAYQSKMMGNNLTADQIKAITGDFSEVKEAGNRLYEMFRTMLGGSSSKRQLADGKTFEESTSSTAIDRYARKLGDSVVINIDKLLEAQFEFITKGELNENGQFNPNGTPYPQGLIAKIKAGYFSNKEARNSFIFGMIDARIRAVDPSLPQDFTKILVDGSNKDRSLILYNYLHARIEGQVLASVPEELRAPVSMFLNSYNPRTGSFAINSGEDLIANPGFMSWASATISKYTGNRIPMDAMRLGVKYLTDKFQPQVLAANSTTAKAFDPNYLDGGLDNKLKTEFEKDSGGSYLSNPLAESTDPSIVNAAEAEVTDPVTKEKGKFDYKGALKAMAVDYVIEFVGKTSSLPVGQMKAFYDKYKAAQALYKDFKAGNVDVAQAVFIIDGIFFGGKISAMIAGFDDALGLPAGSTQALLMFAITGNPMYAVQFVLGFIFGSTMECPDYQLEARKNVKKLIRKVIKLGQFDASLIPSQIITFSQAYLDQLSGAINRNYHDYGGLGYDPCPPLSRCGVFARPEYGFQVHIGF